MRVTGIVAAAGVALAMWIGLPCPLAYAEIVVEPGPPNPDYPPGSPLPTYEHAGNLMAWNNMIFNCMARSAHFRAKMEEYRNSPKKITVRLVSRRRDVLVDSYGDNLVDIWDLQHWPAGDPARTMDACEIILHFLEERLFQACNPGTLFAAAHAAGFAAQCAYRASVGYTDWVSSIIYDQAKRRICITWADRPGHPAPPGTPNPTYVPAGGLHGVIGASLTSITPDPAGGTRYTFSTSRHLPAAALISLPPSCGGKDVPMIGFDGTIAIRVEPDYGSWTPVHVVEFSIVGQPTTWPCGSTGNNYLTLDTAPPEDSIGYLNRDTGQMTITFWGKLTNDEFAGASAVPFFAQLNCDTWDDDAVFARLVVHASLLFADNDYVNTLVSSSQVTYSPDALVGVVGTPITSMTPTVTGPTVTAYSITPSLPSGLSINSTTGVISGTPTAVSPTTEYVIAADSSEGRVVEIITLTINGS